MIDPTGSLITMIREVPGVAALVGARVRHPEPHGATGGYEGDALGPGHYKAFIVLVALSLPPEFRVPIMRAEYALRCYGRDSKEAIAVYGAVADGLHRLTHVLRSNGLGIYRVAVTGGSLETDPKTQQPYVLGTIQLIATTQAVVT